MKELVVPRAAVEYVLAGAAEMAGVINLVLNGGDDADVITGSQGNDLINGGDGAIDNVKITSRRLDLSCMRARILHRNFKTR